MVDILRGIRDAFKKTVKTYKGKIVSEKEEPVPYFPSENLNNMQVMKFPRYVLRTPKGDKLIPINTGISVGDEVLVTETHGPLRTEIILEKIVTE